MRTTISLLALMLLSAPALADDIDDAYAVCMKHHVTPPVARISLWKPFPAGWEHCLRIKDAKEDRDRAARDADEASNPELKKTRDLAKKLGGAQ